MSLKFCLGENAKLPTYGSADAAGMDLYAAQSVEVKGESIQLVTTNLKCEIPPNTFGMIKSRSGLAYKNWVTVEAGVIDSDYRGVIGVLLHNKKKEPFMVNVGDRIAQMILMPYIKAAISDAAQLTETNRGAGGFGSTGM